MKQQLGCAVGENQPVVEEEDRREMDSSCVWTAEQREWGRGRAPAHPATTTGSAPPAGDAPASAVLSNGEPSRCVAWEWGGPPSGGNKGRAGSLEGARRPEKSRGGVDYGGYGMGKEGGDRVCEKGNFVILRKLTCVDCRLTELC